MLPIFKSSSKEMSLMQTAWASQLNPVLASLLARGRILQSVTLTAGSNTINHGLGRALTGWFVVRQRSQSSWFYDTQDTNPTPALTLTLETSDPLTVDLWVF